MDDDKQVDLDFTLSSEPTYTYTSDAGSTTSGYAPSYSISIGDVDVNDTGSEFKYNEPGISFGDYKSDTEKRLEAIESRLNILVPNPEKLEKFEALKKAYEHYKHLEQLCEIEDEEKNGPNW